MSKKETYLEVGAQTMTAVIWIESDIVVRLQPFGMGVGILPTTKGVCAICREHARTAVLWSNLALASVLWPSISSVSYNLTVWKKKRKEIKRFFITKTEQTGPTTSQAETNTVVDGDS